MNFDKNRPAAYKLQYQLIFVAKCRTKVITMVINKSLKEIAKYIFGNNWNYKLLALETEEDPLHIVFEVFSRIELTSLMNNFKTVSSRLIRREFANYLCPFYWKPYFWNSSYCLLTTGGV